MEQTTSIYVGHNKEHDIHGLVIEQLAEMLVLSHCYKSS